MRETHKDVGTNLDLIDAVFALLRDDVERILENNPEKSSVVMAEATKLSCRMMVGEAKKYMEAFLNGGKLDIDHTLVHSKLTQEYANRTAARALVTLIKHMQEFENNTAEVDRGIADQSV